MHVLFKEGYADRAYLARYADDPALAWLSMINEGNFGNYFGELKKVSEWNKEWNAWLKGKYRTREALAAAWGANLKAEEDFDKETAAFPENIYSSSPRTLRPPSTIITARARTTRMPT